MFAGHQANLKKNLHLQQFFFCVYYFFLSKAFKTDLSFKTLIYKDKKAKRWVYFYTQHEVCRFRGEAYVPWWGSVNAGKDAVGHCFTVLIPRGAVLPAALPLVSSIAVDEQEDQINQIKVWHSMREATRERPSNAHKYVTQVIWMADEAP